jgi:hypothetical protein
MMPGIYEEPIAKTIAEFEKRTGRTYSPAEFPTPESTPKEIRPLVAFIKWHTAEQEQLRVHAALSRYSGQPLPEKMSHLPEKHKELQRVIDLWSLHAKSR